MRPKISIKSIASSLADLKINVMDKSLDLSNRRWICVTKCEVERRLNGIYEEKCWGNKNNGTNASLKAIANREHGLLSIVRRETQCVGIWKTIDVFNNIGLINRVNGDLRQFVYASSRNTNLEIQIGSVIGVDAACQPSFLCVYIPFVP